MIYELGRKKVYCLSIGYFNLQISTRSIELIKSLRSKVELGKDMSEEDGNLPRAWSKTTLKSPPIIV